MPRVIRVIEHHDLRGDGTDGNPFRHVTQYLDFDGKVLAEQRDEYPTTRTGPAVMVTTDYKQRTLAEIDGPTCVCEKRNPGPKEYYFIDPKCPLHGDNRQAPCS